MKKYAAFISYSRKDETEAKRLHKKIEAFKIPENLVLKSKVLLSGKKIQPVFRDRDELATSHNLTDTLLKSLDASEYLIVICSPNSAKSKWVDAEVKHFLENGDRDKIIYLVIDGNPMASLHSQNLSKEAFTPSTLIDFEEFGEPLWADLRPESDGRNLAWAKVIAGLIGSSVDVVLQRQKQIQKRVFTAYAVVFTIFIALIFYLVFQARTERSRLAKQTAYERSLSYSGQVTSYETVNPDYDHDRSLAWAWLALSIYNNELKGEKPPSEVIDNYNNQYAQQFIRTLLLENNQGKPIRLLEDNSVILFPGFFLSPKERRLKKFNLLNFQSVNIDVPGVSEPKSVFANKQGDKFFFETEIGKPNLIWNGTKIFEISNHFRVKAYFSSNDKYLVIQPWVSGASNPIEIWNVNTGQLMFSAQGIESAISEDLKYFSLIKKDGTLELYSSEFERLQAKRYVFKRDNISYPPYLSFYGTKNLLIVSIAEKTEFLNVTNFSVINKYENPDRFGEELIEIPNSKMFLVKNLGTSLLIRNSDDWKIISRIHLNSPNGVYPEAFASPSSDGKLIFWGDSGGGIKVIDFKSLVQHYHSSLSIKLAQTFSYLAKKKPLSKKECKVFNVPVPEICQ